MSASEGRDPSQPPKRASVSVSYSDSYGAGENQDELHKVESSYGFGMSHPDDDEEEPGDLHHHMTEEDKGHEHNVKAHHEGWNSLAEKHRGRCTDCTCLILIVIMWYCMTMLGFVCLGWYKDDRLGQGNPLRLINSMDYNGNICGYDEKVKDLGVAYYMLDGSVVCIKKCPKEADYNSFICRYENQEEADAASLKNQYKLVNDYKCMYQIKTREFINRCWPDMSITQAFNDASTTAAVAGVDLATYATYDVSSNKHSSWFNDFVGDIYALRGYIFGFGLGVSVLVAFVYVFLLHIPGLLFTIIWGLIVSIQGLLIAGAFLLWELANKWKADDIHTYDEIKTMKGFAYFMMAVAFLYFCVMVVMRRRIELAIEVVKTAAAALTHMPAIICLPGIQAVGLTIFMVPWLIYLLYLASSGDITVESQTLIDSTGNTFQYNYRVFSYGKNSKYALLYFLFCYFWTSEFIIAIGQLTIALAFTAYYFSRDKSTVGNGTVVWALRTCISTHLGTCAYGSLIVAIIRTIKAVIQYMIRKAKKADNKALEYILKCALCCLTCIEKCVKFINKHAYILVAIYGYEFCKACRRAFFLLLRNILRVSAVNMVAFFVLNLGRLFVPMLTTFLCYLVLGYQVPDDKASGIVAPCFFVFTLAWFISTMFSELFGMGIETILFCYIADEEMFEPENRFAEKGLIATIRHVERRKKEIKVVEKTSRENFKNSMKSSFKRSSKKNTPPPNRA